MSRFIYIGNEQLTNALTSKRKLDAFSLLLITKATFTSSSYHNPNVVEVQKLLQVSKPKAKQIIQDCITYGYARMENNNMIFNKISKKGNVRYKLDISKLAKMNVNKRFCKKSDTNTRCVNLELLKQELRSIKLNIKFQQKKFVVDTIKGIDSENHSVAEIKQFQKDFKKYAMKKDNVDNGISIHALMKEINIGNRNKMIQIINYMIKSKKITKQRNIHKIGVCKNNTFYQSDEFGCFFTYNNFLYQVTNNSYSNTVAVSAAILK